MTLIGVETKIICGVVTVCWQSQLVLLTRRTTELNALKCVNISIALFLLSTMANKYLCVSHCNAQSLSAQFGPIKNFMLNYGVHVMGISESFLKPGKESRWYAIPHYVLHRHDRTTRGGGGVAMYVHESIKSKVVAISPQSTADDKRPEYLFVELGFESYKFLCALVYNPPKVGYWCETVEEALLNCRGAYDNIFLIGDFNINWYSTLSPRVTLAESLETCNLHRLPLNGTHHGANPFSTIDYFCLLDDSHLAFYSQHYMPIISEHEVLLACFVYNRSHPAPKTITRRCYKNFNAQRFHQDLRSIEWEPIITSPDVDHKVSLFSSSILSLYDKHAPFRTFTVRANRPSPWLTPELRGILRARNNACRIYNRTRTESDKLTRNLLRNRAKLAVRYAISRYHRDKFLKCKSPREFWNCVNEIGLSNKPDVSSELPFDVDTLNSHFVGSTSHNNSTPISMVPVNIETNDNDRFFFRHVESRDVLEAIHSARSNALGPDGIPLRFLIDCSTYIIAILQNIFDTSLQSGIFPASWKPAIVRPIPKVSTPKRLQDFRPISITCASPKLLESVVHTQVSEFIAQRNLLDPCQSGFRKFHSTHSAVTKIVDDIRIAIDSRKVTLLVAIDFSRAFDVVNIQLLCDKLYNMGFSSSACNWFCSYLSGRSQVVTSFSNERSQPKNRYSGVPQGSILGPLLFSLFINDIGSVLKHCSYHLYADDFCIYIHGSFADIPDIIRRINEDLVNIMNWARSNLLIINVEKTGAMWFGSTQYMSKLSSLATPDILLNGTVIRVADSLKILGVTLDPTLTFRTECGIISRKCSAALYRLRRCSESLTSNCKLTLFRALILPYFDYCASLFIPLSDELATKLGRCMNAALRFVTGVRKSDHISPSYMKLNLLPYKYRIQYLTLSFLASILRNGQPSYLISRFKFRLPDQPGSKRASRLDLMIPRASLVYLSDSFYISGANMWNALPLNIRMLYQRPCFKYALYDYIFCRFKSEKL